MQVECDTFCFITMCAFMGVGVACVLLWVLGTLLKPAAADQVLCLGLFVQSAASQTGCESRPSGRPFSDCLVEGRLQLLVLSCDNFNTLLANHVTSMYGRACQPKWVIWSPVPLTGASDTNKFP